jgi:hypothetical protein
MLEENKPPLHDLNYAGGQTHKRWPWWIISLVIAAMFLLAWFNEEATTFVPGSRAEYQQWFLANTYLSLGSISLGMTFGSLISRWQSNGP